MENTKDKSYKTYSKRNRYQSVPYYYNTLDDKYVYGLTYKINKNCSHQTHVVKDYDTLENISNKYYGKSYYYDIIADFNDIADPFVSLYPKYKSLEIPDLAAVEYIH